jgi:hypothetical protein
MFWAPVCGSWTPSLASSRTTEFGTSIFQPPASPPASLIASLMPLMIGWEAASSLPCWGSSMPMLIVPLPPELALVATGEHEHADGGERADLAEFHSLSSSNARRRVAPTTSVGVPPLAADPSRPSSAGPMRRLAASGAGADGWEARRCGRTSETRGIRTRRARLPPKRCRI